MQNRRLLQNWGFNEIGGSMIKSIILKYFEEPLHIEIVRQTGKVLHIVPKSQLLVFYRFVTNIYKNLRVKKPRFLDQMELTVKSKIRV